MPQQQLPTTQLVAFLRGQDLVLQFTMLTPQAITGWGISFRVYPGNDTSGAPIFTKTVGAGIAITDGPNGVIQVTLLAGDTAGLPATADYTYTLARTDTGNNVFLATGPLVLQSPKGV
jgi:hypothetical protein